MNKRTVATVAVGLLVLVVVAVLALSPFFDWYARQWETRVFIPLNVAAWSPKLALPFALTLLCVPLACVAVMVWALAHRLLRKSQPVDYYRPAVDNLELARSNVLSTVSGLEGLAAAIDENFRKYDEVRRAFDHATLELRENAEALGARVNFIYRETRLQRWAIGAIAFTLGLAAKVMADHLTHLVG